MDSGLVLQSLSRAVNGPDFGWTHLGETKVDKMQKLELAGIRRQPVTWFLAQRKMAQAQWGLKPIKDANSIWPQVELLSKLPCAAHIMGEAGNWRSHWDEKINAFGSFLPLVLLPSSLTALQFNSTMSNNWMRVQFVAVGWMGVSCISICLIFDGNGPHGSSLAR